ncbi:hypothetical protein [Rhodoplanes roseus]|uniref:hypothetical protein n=1 Tax=Rhodoplanes roseus TaxID=29409 RepID=UPI0011B7118D|nr:hypothetical protein [Rhodoplanes roseus]
MLTFELPTRIARSIAGAWRAFATDMVRGVWLVSWDGRVHGALRHDGSRWWLDWLPAADPRLASYDGPLAATPDEIVAVLARHIAAATPAGAASDVATLHIDPVIAF